MPQIGQLRKGLWVASGFGRQGLNTSAIAGQLIARSILWGDERWRLFSPFELVWAGGTIGRVAGQIVGLWERGSSAAAGALARHRERARAKERIREAKLAEANRQAAVRPAGPRRPQPGRPVPGRPRPVRPAPPPPVQLRDGEKRVQPMDPLPGALPQAEPEHDLVRGTDGAISQESEKLS
jgi:hypothetical protein